MSYEENQPTGLEIAVIGMACRFPGAGNIDEYWRILEQGIETVTFFTDDQLEAAGVPPEEYQEPDYVKANSVLADADCFDAAFFGFSPREAEILDPQTRLFHECAWHALEDAACDPSTYGGLISVFAGAAANFSWQAQTLLSGAGSTIDPFAASQLKSKDFLGTHVAYRLNLKGPAIMVASACSTSLMAIILASQGLLSGECDLALAGGVAARFPQDQGYQYREGMIASPDGHCRAFDAESKGTYSGNGVGVVALKLLENANEDGDHVYAVIKGSGLNNDGSRKVGYTAPSIDGQAEVIRAAIDMADVPVESITYVEAHGTGTSLGDPVEVAALKTAFDTPLKGYCGLGSAKTNFGHLDAAAGVAGFIKAVLALHYRIIPPSLHFNVPNPKIDFADSPFYVNTTAKPWINNRYPLRAGVSSFGIGGTNAHVVLEEAPPLESFDSAVRNHYLLLLSAKTEEALDRITVNLAAHLQASAGINMADAAYTLQKGRQRLPHRRMVVCSSMDEAVAMLTEPGSPDRRSFHSKDDKRPLVFMFPGQGAQYVNMGLELYKNEPVFREEMDRCFAILQNLSPENFKDILYPQPGSTDNATGTAINRTAVTQPLIFAFEYAMARQLNAWGITPYAMTGHSIGEYVAAHFSGVFSLEDALALVVKRGQLMQELPGGSMMSITLSEAELLPLLPEGIALAAVNNPSLCTVSGPDDVVSTFKETMQARGIEVRLLHTSHAFHSAMMDPVLEAFEAEVRKVKRNSPEIPFISNVTGTWISTEDAQDPAYWSRHLRQTVRFADGAALLLEEDQALFLEVGPGMVLSTFIGKHPTKQPTQKTVNLVRHPKENIPDDRFLAGKLGQLWLYGVNIDWDGFWGEEKRQRLRLPLYPFAKQRFPFPDVDMNTALFQQQSMGKQDISQWFYQPSWKQGHLPAAAPFKMESKSGNCCLILQWETGPGVDWGEGLKQQGFDVVDVIAGEGYLPENANRIHIHPGEQEHYFNLFQYLKEKGKRPALILHLLNLGPVVLRDDHKNTGDIDGLSDGLSNGLSDGEIDAAYYSILHLAQAVGKYHESAETRMLVVSDGLANITGDEMTQPGKALLMGPVGTIPSEYPNIHCRSVDITLPRAGIDGDTDTASMPGLLEMLMRESVFDTVDRVIAYRHQRRWVLGFEPVSPVQIDNSTPQRLKQKGVYLVTGGMGGIGLTLAHYLAETVNAKLVLTGRSPVAPDDERIQSLEKAGGEVLFVQADAANFQETAEAVRRAEDRFGTINGVIHSAGLPDAGMIQIRTREMSEQVFAAKVHGTLNLDRLFREKTLDFFSVCSSMASLYSPFGQTAYTAANCFQDAFVWHKSMYGRSIVKPGCIYTAINWDTWQQVGMAAASVKNAGRDADAELSFGILPEEGKQVFAHVLKETLPQLMISTRDLEQVTRQMRQATEMMDPSSAGTPGTGETGTTSGGTVFQRPELSTEYVAPGTENEKKLEAILKQILGIDRVGIFDNFFELGISSLDVISINNQLKSIPGLDISTVVIFEHPFIQALAQYIDRQTQSEADGGTEPPPATVEKKDRSDEIGTGKNRLMRLKKKSTKS